MADCQQPPFLSPCPPFWGPLFGGLREGKSIIMIGQVLPNADRFTVDLQCGSNNDIGLHFSPCFEDGAASIVYNSCENGSWGKKEKSDCPFVKGQTFTLEIQVTTEAFKISVNGKHLKDFKHRFQFTRVDTVAVFHMVALDFIAYQKPACPPFWGPLFGGLQEGKSIIMIGRVLPNADRFTVDLQCGSYNGADIGLHFSPRFEDGAASIVYNSCENGSWGKEEKSDCPFVKGQTFTLEIHVTKEAFKISVNGKHLKDFKHRFQFTRVDTVAVFHMVALDFIAYQKPATVPYKTLITDGLQPGRDIVIHGIPKTDAKRIDFNLRHRFGIAFHYKCLFEENVVVCNTFENGSWGTQEVHKDVPLKRGEFFRVKISCQSDHFDVFVNGKQTHTYDYRFKTLEDIDVFEVLEQLELVFAYV